MSEGCEKLVLSPIGLAQRIELPSADGIEMNAVSDPDGVKYLACLVTWVDGDLLANGAHQRAKLLATLGRMPL